MKLSQRKKGFTLIELLIVIGLLGALTALVLPSLSADRTEAMADACDYSHYGTVRTLKQFRQVTGHYPAGLHTGLVSIGSQSDAFGSTGSTPVDGVMPGLPSALAKRFGSATAPGKNTQGDSTFQLTANQVLSLEKAGLTTLSYGGGLNSVAVATGNRVIRIKDTWRDDGNNPFSFDGTPVFAAAGTKSWTGKPAAGGTATPADCIHKKINKGGTVIVLWVAPTTDWDSRMNTGNDWSKGNVELKIDLEGKCPVPTQGVDGTDDVSFSYYMAFFLVDDTGAEPAVLIGASCPEDGLLNP